MWRRWLYISGSRPGGSEAARSVVTGSGGGADLQKRVIVAAGLLKTRMTIRRLEMRAGARGTLVMLNQVFIGISMLVCNELWKTQHGFSRGFGWIGVDFGLLRGCARGPTAAS